MTTAESIEIIEAINSRKVFGLPRNKLEQFIVALSTSDAYTHFSAPEFPAICETVRMALAMRVSEDANLQAKRESRIALNVSVFALVAGLVQAAIAIWGHWYPSPVQVYSEKANPVHVLLVDQSAPRKQEETQKSQVQAPNMILQAPPSKPSLPSTKEK